MQASDTIALPGCPTPAELHAFDRGFLSNPEIDRISTHLENGCRQCSIVLDSFGESDEFAKSLRSANSPVVPSAIGGNRYQLVAEIGRGGMGIVYQATDTQTRRTIALKQLTGDLATNPLGIARFQQEVQALARIEHPNVVRLYDSDLECSTPYLVMEFVDGESLSKRLNGKPLAPSEAATILQKVASAVHAVHSAGILHRDLKPGNILLTHSGEPKVSDFGLARPVGDSESRLTRTGAVLGTPEYMPPEQAQGEWASLTPATDVYSLGASFYEMLTGRPPFRGPNTLSVLDQVIRAEPLAPTKLQPSIPKDLQTICLKCLEKTPKSRYQSASALAEDLHRWQLGQPILARPARTAERLIKWTRRNPAVATLLAAVAIVLIAGSVVSSVFAILASRRSDAERASRTEAERSAYELAIFGADLEWANGRADKALALLEASPEQFRYWDWHYMWQRSLRADTLVAPNETPHMIATISDEILPKIRFISGANNLHEFSLTHGRELSAPLPMRSENGRLFAFSANGRHLAVVSEPTKIGIWALDTQICIGTIVCDESATVAIALSNDAKYFVRANLDNNQIEVWDCTSLSHIRTLRAENVSDFDTRGVPKLGVFSLAFSADGNRIAAGTRDQATVWDVPTGRQLRQVAGHLLSNPDEMLAITSVAFVGSEGKQLLTGGRVDIRVPERAELLLHDLEYFGKPRVLANDRRGYEGLTVSSNGKLLAYLDGLRQVTVHEAASGKITGQTRSLGVVSTACFTANARQLVLGTTRGVEVRDISLESATEVIQDVEKDRVYGLAVADSGRTVIFTTRPTEDEPQSKRLCIWDRSDQEVKGYFSLGNLALASSDLAISKDATESLLAVAVPGEVGGVQIWDWRNRTLQMTLTGVAGHVSRVQFTSDNRVLALVKPHRLCIWSLDQPRQPRIVHQSDVEMSNFAVSPDETCVAIGVGDHRAEQPIKIVQLADNAVRRSLETGASQTSSLAFASDGRLAFSTFRPATLQVWDWQTGKLLAITRETHTFPTTFTFFAPDEKRIITGSQDDTIKVWDAERCKELLVLRGHKAAINRGVMLPNGLLFTSSWDGTVRMWDGRAVK